MRIALVIWQMDTYGGSIRQCIELARHLQEQGHDVEIITTSINRQHCFPELTPGLNIVVALPIRLRHHIYPPSTFVLLRIWWYIYNDIVQQLQVRSLTQALLGRHHDQPFDAINYHDNGIISAASHFPRSMNSWMMNDPPSFIDTMEKDASPYAQSALLRFLVRIQSWTTQRMLLHIQTIMVLDRRNEDIVQRYFHRDSVVVRSGLDLRPSLRRWKVKPTKRDVQLLTTNIFFRHRRYEDVIDALYILTKKHHVTNFVYRIIGDPASDPGYYAMICDRIHQYGLEKYVQFLGRVNEKTLRENYKKADIFIFPNHNQTWGLSVFEAMAAGAACIVSKTSGASELCRDGSTALLVPPKDPDAIAKALKKLIRQPVTRTRIAKYAHQFVRTHISWERYASDMAHLL